jgi:hypothetical protein
MITCGKLFQNIFSGLKVMEQARKCKGSKDGLTNGGHSYNPLSVLQKDIDKLTTYMTSCSMPIPINRPIIAPTAILGMNNPDGTLNIQQQYRHYSNCVYR